LKRVLCMNVYITHTHIIYWYIYIYIVCIREYAVPAILCEPMWTRKIRNNQNINAFQILAALAPLGYFFTRAALCSRRLHPECSPVEETAARATVQGKWALLSLDITWQFQVKPLPFSSNKTPHIRPCQRFLVGSIKSIFYNLGWWSEFQGSWAEKRCHCHCHWRRNEVPLGGPSEWDSQDWLFHNVSQTELNSA
jgi:uncharacterized membrane protein YhaH (DUF805 family)